MKNNVVTEYVKRSLEELSQVVWPTKNQAVKLTIIVLIFCLVASVALAGVDYVLNLGHEFLLGLTS